MSAKSLGELAEDRDVKQPGKSIGSATDVLVAAVPTEALAAYTTLIGIVLAANIGATYSQFRWSAYGAFVALAILAPLVVYRHRVATSRNQKRIFPIEECLVAGLAAAAWGLVMPGSPLGIVLKGNALVFTTTAIIVGAATVIGFVTPVLGSANRKNPTDEVTAPAAPDAPAPDAKVAAPAAPAVPAAPAATDGEVTTPAAADGEAPAPAAPEVPAADTAAAANAEAPAPAAADAEITEPTAADTEAAAPAAPEVPAADAPADAEITEPTAADAEAAAPAAPEVPAADAPAADAEVTAPAAADGEVPAPAAPNTPAADAEAAAPAVDGH